MVGIAVVLTLVLACYQHYEDTQAMQQMAEEIQILSMQEFNARMDMEKAQDQLNDPYLVYNRICEALKTVTTYNNWRTSCIVDEVFKVNHTYEPWENTGIPVE